MTTIELRYFAWVRERIGHPSETIETKATTVIELIDHLRTKGVEYELAFNNLKAIRAAIDQELVEFDAPLTKVKEVAFFPPMTGG